MRKHLLADRLAAAGAVGGIAVSLGFWSAGPVYAAAPATGAVTLTKCTGHVCETVTLSATKSGDRIVVFTTGLNRNRQCTVPTVTVVWPHGKVTVKAKPECNQTVVRQDFTIGLKKLVLPVTVSAQWSHIAGHPTVIFRSFR